MSSSSGDDWGFAIIGRQNVLRQFFDDSVGEEERTEEVAADNCPIYFTDTKGHLQRTVLLIDT